MVSTVTNRGTVRFMVYDGALFVTFLQRLVKATRGRKILVIVDNLKVHHAKKVKAWVAAHQDRIALVFLPPYAPEHNPGELLNHDVKRSLAKRPAPKDQANLRRTLRSTMRRLQRTPAKVKAFFQAPTTAYAA
jgi:transposase